MAEQHRGIWSHWSQHQTTLQEVPKDGPSALSGNCCLAGMYTSGCVVDWPVDMLCAPTYLQNNKQNGKRGSRGTDIQFFFLYISTMYIADTNRIELYCAPFCKGGSKAYWSFSRLMNTGCTWNKGFFTYINLGEIWTLHQVGVSSECSGSFQVIQVKKLDKIMIRPEYTEIKTIVKISTFSES